MANPTSKYASQLQMLSPLFPDWDEDALASVLADTRGNAEEAAVLITDGRATMFTTASRKKEKKPASSKPNGHTNGNADSGGFAGTDAFSGRGGFRGGRGGSRGGRGGSDSTRGALRGGRGGSRGGRGGYRGGRPLNGLNDGVPEQSTSTSAWGSTAGEAPSSEAPATTEDAWATAPSSSEPTAPKPSNNEEFAASGGWGDAPTVAETEAAVESAGAWGQAPSAIGDVPPVPKKALMTVTKAAKLSWAQIARPPPPPAPKPAPVPQATTAVAAAPAAVEAAVEPAPVAEQEEESTAAADEIKQEDLDVAPQSLDQPEVVATETEVPEAEQIQEPEPVQTQEDPLQETEVAAAEPMKDPWSSTPAPVSAWEQNKESAAPAVSDLNKPAAQTDAYAGPPGFNPAIKAAIAPVRTNSRAALRYKTDGQAVMLPTAAASGLDMQFGNLNFGNPDGAEADDAEQAETAPEQQPEETVPEQQQEQAAQPNQAQANAQATPASQSVQVSAQPTQLPSPPASVAQQASIYGTTLGYYPSQQQYGQYSQTQTQQPLPQQYYQQSAPQQQQTAAASPVAKESQTVSTSSDQQASREQAYYQQQQQPQAQYESRYQDAYGQSQGQQAQSQQQQQQTQQQQSAYGNFGPQAAYGYLQAPSQLAPPPQHASTPDAYSSESQRQSLYDSYAASGYPRQGGQEAPKQATPQPLSAQTSGLASPAAQPQQQAPPSGYYSGVGMSGYYAPYNPYFQYGQAPTPGYQSYYPMAQGGRGPYQPAPAAPSGPLMSQTATTKPGQSASAQGHYGGQTSAYDDSSYLGRYGDKAGQQQQPFGYQSQFASQNYLATPTAPSSLPTGATSSRPGQTADEDPYKTGVTGIGRTNSATGTQSQTIPGQQQQQQQQQQQHQQQQQQLSGAQQQFPNYGYSTGYPQQNDWAQYAQYRGGQQGGYWS